MRLGIDIDDTISDTYEVLFNMAQKYTIEELGRVGNLNKEKCYSHHYIEFIHKWSNEENNNFWKKYYFDMINKVKPKTFAVEYLNKLSISHEIYLITSRFNEARELTKEWLEKYNIPYKKLIFAGENKVQIVEENKIDIFIDDSFENCKTISKNGIKTFIMDTRTNNLIDMENENFTRVYSWPQVYYEINKLKE